VVDGVLEQGARDATAAALRGDVEIADRPGSTEHQRRRQMVVVMNPQGRPARTAAAIVIRCWAS
jgi:hypothetical protein